MHIIPALRRLRKKDHEFKASLETRLIKTNKMKKNAEKKHTHTYIHALLLMQEVSWNTEGHV
jgi:hypothetical protein